MRKRPCFGNFLKCLQKWGLATKVSFLAKENNVLLKLFRVHLSRHQSLLHQRHKSMPSFTNMLLRVCSAPQKCTQRWCKKCARNHQIYVLPEVFREDSPMTDLPSLIDHEKSEAKLATILETNRRLGFKYLNLNEE